MANLGATFTADMGDDFISAVDELKARDQWVAWKLLTRPGASKPTKPPVNPNTGGPASHSDPRTWSSHARAEARAKRDSLAGVGYVLTEDDDYTGIDLDKCRDPATGEIEPWAKAILDLAETYAEVSPSGTGVRMIARGKIEKAIKSDVAHVEIYVSQRYLTITEQHIEGTPNEIREAPKTLAALIARAESMRPKREEPQPSSVPPRPSSPPRGNETRERAWAWKALEGVTSELASQGEGGRNHVLNAAAYRLGRLVARGWIAQEEAIAALEESCRANGLWKDDGPKGVRATLMSGLRSGMAQPHEDLPESEYGSDPEAEALGEKIATKLVQMAEATEIHEKIEEIASSEDQSDEPSTCAQEQPIIAETLPAHLTQPPGVLGEMIDWIEASAQLPNRALSLGAAITALGTVIGRRVAGPTKSGTHLYIVALAPSGSGKDHAPRRVTEILGTLCAELVGPSEFMSQSAVMRHMRARPLSLCCIDEFGAFLGRVTNPRSGNHEKLISKQLREYWGASFEIVRPAMWASHENDMEPIVWPALSILGSGVHDEFFSSLSSKETVNGFLNRFLMLSSAAPVEIVDEPVADKREIPPAIIEQLKALFSICRGNFYVPGDGNLARAEVPENPLYDDHRMVVIPWADDATKNAYFALRRRALERQQKTGTELWARTAEIAVRLATIHAVSRAGLTAETRIEAADYAWAEEIAIWSATTMEREAELRIADTEAQARAKFVLLTIRKSGRRVTQRDLNRKLQHRYRSIELKDTLEALAASGAITLEKATPKKGGPTTFIYSIPKKNGGDQ